MTTRTGTPPSLREVYDHFARTYEANRQAFDLSGVLEAFHARLEHKPGSLLDLGCGAGEPVANWFLQRGWSVVGVDFSPAMLALARRHAPAMRTLLADMGQVEFREASFDAIIASYSLFHLPRDQHPRLFARACNWLRPGGKMLFTYATQAYTGQPEFDGYKTFLGTPLYYSHLRREALMEALEAAGLRIESADDREIGGETFLWMTVARPA